MAKLCREMRTNNGELEENSPERSAGEKVVMSSRSP